MIKKIFAGLLLVIALNYTVKSQNLNTAKLDSFFSALTTHNKNMGSLAISSDGMVVYQKAIGYSTARLMVKQKQQQPLKPNIASAQSAKCLQL